MRIVYQRLVGTPRARQIIRLLIAEGPNFPELTEFHHTEVVQRAIGLLERLLARGIERGEIRPGPILDYPHVVIGPAVMAVIWQLLFSDRHPLDLARFFDAHLDLVSNGLAAH